MNEEELIKQKELEMVEPLTYYLICDRNGRVMDVSYNLYKAKEAMFNYSYFGTYYDSMYIEGYYRKKEFYELKRVYWFERYKEGLLWVDIE